MISGIQFSSDQLMLLVGALLAVVFLLIFGLRMYINRQSKAELSKNSQENKSGIAIKSRNKYDAVDVFKYRPVLLKFSLSIVIALVFIAFNWTSYPTKINIPDYDLRLEEDIQIEPPRSQIEAPPPPPPAPSMIQEVPDEIVLEEETPEFVDQSVTEETVVYADPVVEKENVKEDIAPPPPPPPKKEIEEIFKVVEEMPRFSGCEDMHGDKDAVKKCAEQKLLEFIYSNIKYPPIARENDVQGTVVIQFVVNSQGKIQDATIVRDIGAKCGEEALRVVNLMPDWSPGKQRGITVNVLFNLPIKFELKTGA